MKLLYMDDSYLKEFDAKVIEVFDNLVVLDQTAFFPVGGGLPCDTGKLVCGDAVFRVVSVSKRDGKVCHEVVSGLRVGDLVKGFIDWDNRYLVMRYHTAAHVLSAVLHRSAGVLITGNQVSLDKLRIGFDLEEYDPERIKGFVDVANQELSRGQVVRVFTLPRDDALKIPGIVKLANAFPPSLRELRIVEIGDVDVQADGGPHVRNTSEVGVLVFLRSENKGKNNRRIYLKIE